MASNQFRALGRSGLIVSPLALGTMTFGTQRWGADRRVSQEIFKTYLEAGGNFVDTADIYSGGQSEEMVGSFIKEFGVRDDVVLATKFAFNQSASPLGSAGSGRGNPNAGGAGAKNIHRALEGSLKRLKTDYVDLYWMHIWDGVTPVEEIVQTLGDLVRAGKIRYYAFSDMPAWVAMKAATIASERRIPGPIALQVEYSLVAKDVEREHIPVALEAGMGVVPWSPLAGGFLTGKYKREDTSSTGRLSGANPFGNSKFSPQNWEILKVVQEIASIAGVTPSQVSLAWLLQKSGVQSILVGASKVSQLNDNLAALDVQLSSEQIKKLDEASAIAPGFSDSLTSLAIRRMVFGGHDVRGWSDRP
jgi:aryl-alcohol dehydrogenase-like predicted oxidoreductase